MLRAHVEASAFGARVIVEHVERAGVRVDHIVCTGAGPGPSAPRAVGRFPAAGGGGLRMFGRRGAGGGGGPGSAVLAAATGPVSMQRRAVCTRIFWPQLHLISAAAASPPASADRRAVRP